MLSSKLVCYLCSLFGVIDFNWTKREKWRFIGSPSHRRRADTPPVTVLLLLTTSPSYLSVVGTQSDLINHCKLGDYKPDDFRYSSESWDTEQGSLQSTNQSKEEIRWDQPGAAAAQSPASFWYYWVSFSFSVFSLSLSPLSPLSPLTFSCGA